MSRKPVTISLPADLVKQTTRFCRKRSLTLSEVAREAFRKYLRLQEMEELREEFTAHLAKRGILTEQQLLRALGD